MPTRIELDTFINNLHLGEIAKSVRDSAQKALRLIPRNESVGDSHSHFGGVPYVPKGFEWPLSRPPLDPANPEFDPHQYVEGPMRFICQVNLSELPFVPVKSTRSDLVIAVFAATHKSNFPETECAGEDWLVVATVEGEGEVCSPPSLEVDFVKSLNSYSDAPIIDGSILLPTRSIQFQEYWQFDPKFVYSQPDLPAELDHRLKNLPCHLMGGYSNFLQVPVEETAGEFRSEPVERMKNLFQFDSDDTIQLNWSGGGRAFFVAPDTGRSMDFEQSVLITQQ